MPLKELFLLRQRSIELRFDRGNSTLGMPDVKACAELDTEQFVRDVERRHHRDALGAHHFSRLVDLVHLGVEIRDRLHQRRALVVVAGHMVGPSQQVDFDGLRALGHALASAGQAGEQAFQASKERASLPTMTFGLARSTASRSIWGAIPGSPANTFSPPHRRITLLMT